MQIFSQLFLLKIAQKNNPPLLHDNGGLLAFTQGLSTRPSSAQGNESCEENGGETSKFQPYYFLVSKKLYTFAATF